MMVLFSVLVEVAFLGLLVFLIVSLVRTMRRATLQRVPLLPDQTVMLPQAARIRLCLEGPPFATYGVRLRYVLHEQATGRPVQLTPSALGGGSNSFTRQRVTRAVFASPAAGWYRLLVDGFEPRRDYRDYAVVFARPITGPLVGHIVGIVLVGLVVVWGLVAGIVLLAGD